MPPDADPNDAGGVRRRVPAVLRPLRALARAIGSLPALVLILGAGTIAAAAVAFAVARVYDAVTDRDGVAALDVPILQAAARLRAPLTNALAGGVAEVFGPIGMPILAVAAIAVLTWARRSWTPLILVATAGVGSLLMTIAGKDIIGRHRPLLADAIPPFEYSPSFPSGHTLNATVIAGTVGYLLLLHRRTVPARAACVVVPLLLALVVGGTRILLGAHWFTDVLAGWLLGATWLAVVITVHRAWAAVHVRGDRLRADPPASDAPEGRARRR